MKFQVVWVILTLFISVLSVFYNESAQAQCNTGSPTCTLIAGSGANTNITKFGICRKITNNNSGTIMVPHNTAAEWCGTTSGCTGGTGSDSFIQRLPTNVTAATCVNFGPMNWTDCSCSSSSNCSCTTNLVSISGSGTLGFAFSGSGSASYNLGGTGYVSLPGSLAVTSGQTLIFRFNNIECSDNTITSSLTITDNSTGAIIDFATNGRNTKIGCL